MGFLVVLLTVLGVCVLVAAGLAFERRFGRAIDAWASGTSKPSLKAAPAPRRWTEAQLFEPVSKWVEDAERAVIAAEDMEERVARMGLLMKAAGAPPLPGFAAGGLTLSAGEYVVRSVDGHVVRYLP